MRINAELRRLRPGSKAHKSILQHREKLIQTTEIDALLTTKAQQFNLVPIKVIGDGNCLQYAVNTAHKEQTNHYLANNDDLRLLATALARAYARLQTDQPEDLIVEELKAIELTAINSHSFYPRTS